MSRNFIVRLSEEDHEILDRISRKLRTNRSDLVRWALRYYVLYGPWITAGDTFPGRELRRLGRVEIGPRGQEVRA